MSPQPQNARSDFHQSVMIREVLNWLITDKDGIYLDCTLGGGGHSEAVLRSLNSSGRLLAIDQDIEAIEYCVNKLKKWKEQISYKHDNFTGLGNFLDEQKIEKVDGVLMDLGVSSFQIDSNYRGFSFMQEGPLDMRMDPRQKLDAFQIVNNYPQEKLKMIFRLYGEERRASGIAREIVKARKIEPIESTAFLKSVIQRVAHPGIINKTLARIFQSLRIEVNSELENLSETLEIILDRMKSNARLVVLSYHSLEDRIIKHFLKNNVQRCICPPELPKCVCDRSGKIKILTRHIITPTAGEMEKNRRARSAKMRVAERL